MHDSPIADDPIGLDGDRTRGLMDHLVPQIFVGSSIEAHHLAQGLSEALANHHFRADVTLWTEASKPHHQSVVEWLESLRDRFDLAVFIFSPDDVVVSRGEVWAAPRDNVLFELGFFHGLLARESCFVTVDSSFEVKPISDLIGTSHLTFSIRDVAANGAAAAMAPVAQQLIDEWSQRASLPGAELHGPWYQLTFVQTGHGGGATDASLNAIDVVDCRARAGRVYGKMFRVAKWDGVWRGAGLPLAFEFDGAYRNESLSCTYKPAGRRSGRSSSGVLHMTPLQDDLLRGMYVRQRAQNDPDASDSRPMVTRDLTWVSARAEIDVADLLAREFERCRDPDVLRKILGDLPSKRSDGEASRLEPLAEALRLGDP